MSASTQAEAKEERPACCANTTMCTSGTEWHMQQKKLMAARVQKPSMRRMSRHTVPTERVGRLLPAAAVGGAAFGSAPKGTRPISCG